MHISESGPGDGQTLIFLHGNGTNGSMWKEHMKILTSYHCLAPDFPGYGQSNNQEWVSLDDSADQIIKIIEQTKAGRACFSSIDI